MTIEKPTQKLIDVSSPLFQEVIHLHQTGQLDAAQNAYHALLVSYPEDHRILSNLGTLYLQQGDFQKGINKIESSLVLHGDQPHAQNSLGNAMAALGDFEKALLHFERAFQLSPGMVEAVANQASALNHLGRLDEALQCVNRALSLSIDKPEYHLLKATILSSLTSFEEALSSLDDTLALNPYLVEAYIERGRAYIYTQREEEALKSYDQAITLNQHAPGAYLGRGMVLQKLGRLEEAQVSLEAAIRQNPQDDKAFTQYGTLLYNLRHYQAALLFFHRAIEINPTSFEAFSNRGNTFYELKMFEAALEDYRVVLELMPFQADTYFNRANVYTYLQAYDLAYSDYKAAYRLNPFKFECLSFMLFSALKEMDWVGVSEILHEVRSHLKQDVNIGPTFPFLAALDDPKMHQRISSNYLLAQLKDKKKITNPFFSIPSEKIKIGYFSSDFREHPVALNLLPLIKNHDRDRFEVIAFDFTPRGSLETPHPILEAFDHVHDLIEVSDFDAATVARELGLDIAIDLNGITLNARTGIFRCGAAPIQVNFLGYPGTMGVKDYDYIIADEAVIPDTHRDQFVERVLHLPHFFMPYAFHEIQAGAAVDRAHFGLPENRFLLCSFNDFYKISEAIFEAWVTILASSKNTVLTIAIRGVLKPEAVLEKFESQGIAPDRIIVAQRTESHAEHLARLALCDLMLDTFPYNSHTTACDAISAGLPLLTIGGQSFASRVSSSLLEHVDVPELIAQDLDEYCQKAIQLADDEVYFQGLRDRLAKGRSHLPSALTYTRNLESLYGLMLDEKQAVIRKSAET